MNTRVSPRAQRMLDKSAAVRATADIPQDEAPKLAEPQTPVGLRSALAIAQARIVELEKLLASQNQIRLPVVLIDPNPHQPRLTFDEGKLRELANDIKAAGGLIHPILVRRSKADPDRYELVVGERRLRAHKLLGEAEISAVVMDADDGQMAVLGLFENISREGLTEYEISKGLLDIENNFPTRAALIAELRISRSKFYRLTAFDRLPAFVLEDLDARPDLLGGHAADAVKAVLDKLGEPAITALKTLWPKVVSGSLHQGKLAAKLEELVTDPASDPEGFSRNIDKLFAGKAQAGNITKDPNNFTIKIKSAMLKPDQEKQLRQLLGKFFKVTTQE